MKLANLTESSDPFTTATTHMSSYDDMMKDREKARSGGKCYTICQMSPDQYIQQTFDSLKEIGEFDVHHCKEDLLRGKSQKLVDKYAGRMEKGDKFPMLVLDNCSRKSFLGDREKSFSQDGVHRALAAKKLNIENVPVMVVDDA